MKIFLTSIFLLLSTSIFAVDSTQTLSNIFKTGHAIKVTVTNSIGLVLKADSNAIYVCDNTFIIYFKIISDKAQILKQGRSFLLTELISSGILGAAIYDDLRVYDKRNKIVKFAGRNVNDKSNWTLKKVADLCQDDLSFEVIDRTDLEEVLLKTENNNG